jgi:hypothetical protein
MDLRVGWELQRLKDLDAVLRILAGDNASELADVPGTALQASRLASEPLMELLMTEKWCLLAAGPMTTPTTATAPVCTGTWSRSRPSLEEVERCGSTTFWCARTDASWCRSSRGSTPSTCRR